MRRLFAGAAAVLALAAGAIVYAIVPAAESPIRPIDGIRPSYAPGAVTAVPNAGAVARRIWMPGLDDGYDPQGLAVAADAIFVSAYRSDTLSLHRGPCRVFRIDAETGAEAGYFDVPSPCGHAGGLAAGDDGNLYIADTRTLFVTPLAAGGPMRRIALGPGLVGGLAMSAQGGIWLGTYREDGSGRLYRFADATLAALKEGDTLRAEQAAASIAIPDYAQGAATGAGALWVARSDTRWGTLDRLDPTTGRLLRRYDAAPQIEGIAFDAAGRLWGVSEAGARHFYDRPLLSLYVPFYPLIFALDTSRLE